MNKERRDTLQKGEPSYKVQGRSNEPCRAETMRYNVVLSGITSLSLRVGPFKLMFTLYLVGMIRSHHNRRRGVKGNNHFHPDSDMGRDKSLPPHISSKEVEITPSCSGPKSCYKYLSLRSDKGSNPEHIINHI